MEQFAEHSTDGAFKGRREDQRLVTGAGCYTTDWSLPGQACAAFLRSDRAHARVRSIDISQALASPGVLAVFTGDDAVAANLIGPPPLVNWPGRGGIPIRLARWVALADGRVRYTGETVAMVVAESLAEANDALERIEIDYEDLPAVIDVDEALAAGAPLVHDDIPGNLCFEHEYGDEAATEAAFARASRVVRVALDSQRLVSNPMEPRACLADWDAGSDSYDFYSSSQGIGLLRSRLSGFSNVPEERLRCHALDVGGGFGTRCGAHPEYALTMLAAKALGRPVRWDGTRTETFLSDHHGRAIRLQGELALDADGRFLAIRVVFKCQMGAYLSEGGPFTHTMTPSLTVIGAYRIPVAYGRALCVMSNTTPVTAYRGAGRPDITLLVEQLVDQAALDSGIDRIELRRRNFIPPEAFPYKTPTSEYDSADFPGMTDEALRQADWAGFAARRAASKARGKLRGLGFASFIEPSGGGLFPIEQTAIWFSGDEIRLHCMTVASGQGHETVFPEIVARTLGVPEEKVVLLASRADGPNLQGSPSMSSRSSLMLGSSFLLGSREVIRKGMQLASEELEAAAADIEFADGSYRVKGTDRAIGLLDLARKHAGKTPHPLDSFGEAKSARAFPCGVHIAEIEIDPETGETEILDYVGVDDCGRPLNPKLVEGQLQGGIMQGVGQVLLEECVYDASGQMLTASFMDYSMPRADTMPMLRLVDRSIPSPSNILGAKGVGEAGTAAGLAVLMSALKDALRQAGVERFEMPATPGRVWTVLSGFRENPTPRSPAA